MRNFQLFTAECPKCEHKWIIRVKTPRLCPKCKKRLYQGPYTSSRVGTRPWSKSIPEDKEFKLVFNTWAEANQAVDLYFTDRAAAIEKYKFGRLTAKKSLQVS